MQKKYIFLLLILCFLAFFYRYSYQLEPINKLVSYITFPILSLNSRVVGSIKEFNQERKTVQQLYVLIAQLNQERDNLEQQLIALQGQLRYVQDTHELHQFAQRYHCSQKNSAQIIARIFSESQHYFFVDAGSNKGIEPDMVAVYKNCLLGRVITVYPCYSKILLITDRSCKIAAICLQTNVQGIHEGTNNNATTQLSFVSRLDSLQIDDTVISSGEGLVFPRGFCLGKIKEFCAGDLHYKVCVEPLIDFSVISYCYLIKK
jgi:rod shape-determining protein MreC